MFERPTGGERALLVHVSFSQLRDTDELNELKLLAISAGAEVIDILHLKRNSPHAKYFLGTGQADHIAQLIQHHVIEVVIINHNLSPAQERNLERLWQCRVIDRIGLILAIFAKRARTHEGKLQVELAQLAHLSTRLVRGWTHLERQKGGIGMRGPGETQLETDRRLLGQRMSTIRQRLQKVRGARQQGRKKRKKQAMPTVSLVGYTNAGKSTLFNQLAHSTVYAADQLFATLDPTLRQISLKKYGEIVLADTVGFIRDLPHELIAAFKATLDETKEADLLLHIVDAHDNDNRNYCEQVNLVLEEIGAAHIPQLLVYNKIDLSDRPAHLERDSRGQVRAVWVSATNDLGMDLLKAAICERLSQDFVYKTITLKPEHAYVRAKLYARNVVHGEKINQEGIITLEIGLPQWEYEKLLQDLDDTLG
ncbi:MAG: GTPase HflX [Legionellales bacterium]|nr:GTPase HflX [Legionellales bacterium]